MLRKLLNRWLIAIAATAGLAGCVSSGWGLSPEERVQQRAQLWMDSMIAMDFESAWELVSPGYKQLRDLGDYRARYRGASWWLSGELGAVQCDADGDQPATECSVLMYVTYNAPMVNMTNKRTLKSRWLLVDGGWFKFEQ